MAAAIYVPRLTIFSTSEAIERMRMFGTVFDRRILSGMESVTISSSRDCDNRTCESFGNTPCGAKAETLLAPFFRSTSAASRIVPPVWMRSSTITIRFPSAFHSLIVIFRSSPSRTLAQTMVSQPSNDSWNRFAAPSSGNAMAMSGSSVSLPSFDNDRRNSFMVECNSIFTLNGSKKKRSESAWISNVWSEVFSDLPGGKWERMSAKYGAVAISHFLLIRSIVPTGKYGTMTRTLSA